MRFAVTVVFVLLTLAMGGCSDRVAGKYGEDLYVVTCAHCHRGDLSGGIGPAIGPDSNAHRELSDDQIVSVIEVGPGAMPSYARRLNSEQIESVIAYLRAVQVGER